MSSLFGGGVPRSSGLYSWKDESSWRLHEPQEGPKTSQEDHGKSLKIIETPGRERVSEWIDMGGVRKPPLPQLDILRGPLIDGFQRKSNEIRGKSHVDLWVH